MGAPAARTIDGVLLGAVVAVAGVLAWLASGGYHAIHHAPLAVLVAVLVVLVVLAGRRSPAALATPPLVAGSALVAYAAWTGASTGWAGDQQAAWEEALRTGTYALVLVLGMLLARERAVIHLLALAVVAVPTIVALAVLLDLSAAQASAFRDGRLLGPIGYFNAQATMLLVPVPIAVALAAQRDASPLARGVFVAAATLDLQVALLTQSRGALVALLLAIGVQLAAGPRRTALVAGHALLFVGVLAAWPALGAVFDTLQRDLPASATIQRTQSAIAIACLALGLAAAASTAAVRRLAIPTRRWRPTPRLRRGVLACLVVLAPVVLVGQVHRADGLDQARHVARSVVTAPPEGSSGAGTRFTMVSANGRLVLWEAALDTARAHPLVGVGGDNYAAEYYRRRSSDVGFVRQPHNLALEVLAERGVVGMLLVVTVLALTARAVVRLRCRGTPSDRVVVGGLAAALLLWVVHAQLDWPWQFHAVTMPVMLVAGVLLGAAWPARRAPSRLAHGGAAAVTCLACLALAAAAAPPWLAWRSADAGARTTDPVLALTRLDLARRMAPRSPVFQRMYAERAWQAGMPARAQRAADRAAALDPHGWASAGYAATIAERRGDLAGARRRWDAARARNPLGSS